MRVTTPTKARRGKHCAEQTDAEVEKAGAKAQECFSTWQKTTFAVRAGRSMAARLLRSNTEKFARLITLDMGKLIAETAEKWRSAQIFSITTLSMPKSSWLPKYSLLMRGKPRS